MLNQGWIKMHRQILDNPLWLSEAFTRAQAWVDLLLLANHEYGYYFIRGNQVDIERGQIARSEEFFASRWKWSRSKVRNFLKTLEKERQIEQQKTSIINKITILNYDFFQESGQQKDDRKTTEERQKNIYKNNKNNKNNKNKEKEDIDKSISKKKKNSFDDDFMEFWEVYGKIGNKQQAIKSYNKIRSEKITHEKIISGVRAYQTYYRVLGKSQRYIKHASTWLNNRGWEDDYTIYQQAKPLTKRQEMFQRLANTDFSKLA